MIIMKIEDIREALAHLKSLGHEIARRIEDNGMEEDMERYS